MFGGTWAGADGLLDDLRAVLRRLDPFGLDRALHLQQAAVPDAPLSGARVRAVDLARGRLLATI